MRKTTFPNIVGPRRITKFRRVALPSRLARAVDIEPYGYVTAARARNDRCTIVIRPCSAPSTFFGQPRMSRPRPVDEVHQVAFPAELLARVGLDIGSWVCFSQGSAAIKMFPADRVIGPVAFERRR